MARFLYTFQWFYIMRMLYVYVHPLFIHASYLFVQFTCFFIYFDGKISNSKSKFVYLVIYVFSLQFFSILLQIMCVCVSSSFFLPNSWFNSNICNFRCNFFLTPQFLAYSMPKLPMYIYKINERSTFGSRS